MKFHNVQMVGRFNVEVRPSVPTFSATRDEGRIIYSEIDDKLFFGGESAWIELQTLGDLTTHTDSNVPNVHGTGTIASQNSNSVDINGGSVTGLTELQVNGNITLTGEIDETI